MTVNTAELTHICRLFALKWHFLNCNNFLCLCIPCLPNMWLTHLS